MGAQYSPCQIVHRQHDLKDKIASSNRLHQETRIEWAVIFQAPLPSSCNCKLFLLPLPPSFHCSPDRALKNASSDLGRKIIINMIMHCYNLENSWKIICGPCIFLIFFYIFVVVYICIDGLQSTAKVSCSGCKSLVSMAWFQFPNINLQYKPWWFIVLPIVVEDSVKGRETGDFIWRIYRSLSEGTIIKSCTSRICSDGNGSISVLDIMCKNRRRYCCCRGTEATELHLRFGRETVEGTRAFTSTAYEVSDSLAESTAASLAHPLSDYGVAHVEVVKRELRYSCSREADSG
jgi:hypothetical protein